MATVIVRRKHCDVSFPARTADRKRGWARFCSKSCKAKEQTLRTGRGKPQHHDDLSEWDRYVNSIHPFSSEAFGDN